MSTMVNEILKESSKKIPNLIHEKHGPWEEFENNFEEGWGGHPEVFCLANHEHHLQVSNLAAYNLSKIFDSQDDLYEMKDWVSIAQKAYDKAAKELYPNEKLWSGDNEDNPEFWKESDPEFWKEQNNLKQSLNNYEENQERN